MLNSFKKRVWGEKIIKVKQNVIFILFSETELAKCFV